MYFRTSDLCIILICIHITASLNFVKLIHTYISRRIIFKHIQWMKTKMKSIFASSYFSFLLVVLAFFVFKPSACHIWIKTLVSFYFGKLLWQSNIIRKICSKYHVRHIICIKSGYSCTNSGEKKFPFRMLFSKLSEVS